MKPTWEEPLNEHASSRNPQSGGSGAESVRTVRTPTAHLFPFCFCGTQLKCAMMWSLQVLGLTPRYSLELESRGEVMEYLKSGT